MQLRLMLDDVERCACLLIDGVERRLTRSGDGGLIVSDLFLGGIGSPPPHVHRFVRFASCIVFHSNTPIDLNIAFRLQYQLSPPTFPQDRDGFDRNWPPTPGNIGHNCHSSLPALALPGSTRIPSGSDNGNRCGGPGGRGQGIQITGMRVVVVVIAHFRASDDS
jgi:hypothetical protein